MRRVGHSAGAILVGIGLGVASAASGDSGAVDARDLVFAIDMQEHWLISGCYAISVVDARNGERLSASQGEQDVGRLAVTSDGDLAVAFGYFGRFLILFKRDATSAPPGWRSDVLPAPRLVGGAVTISPDGQWLALGLPGGQVAKYPLDALRGGRLGSPTGSVSGADAAEILFTADSLTAYVVTPGGEVWTLDVPAMAYVGSPIAFEPVAVAMVRRMRNTFATLSPDERFIVINTGRPKVNVVDLAAGRSWLLDTPGLRTTMGVAFDYVHPLPPRLAVHGHSAVAVYSFSPERLDALGSAPVPPQVPPPEDEIFNRVGTLAWLGRGDGVAAAIGGQLKEYRILDFSSAEGLTRRVDFDACTNTYRPWSSREVDVATVNRVGVPTVPTPTATATAPPTPTATMSPTATGTPTATPSTRPSATETPRPTMTASPTHTAVLTATPTLTPTPTPTPPPGPLYLPVSLRERCVPGIRRVDVVLVIDASTTMRDDRTTAGRMKLAAAIEAAESFLDALALPHDQAAVVAFNSDAQVVQPLTGRRPDVEEALARIPGLVRQQTRIDRGIEVAHAELRSARHSPTSEAAMVVLTDGQANPVPASVAVDRAKAAKDDGITIFTIGLGKDDELDVADLAQMASRPEYFYRAPDGEDLRTIYRSIAVTIPCPAERYWGRR